MRLKYRIRTKEDILRLKWREETGQLKVNNIYMGCFRGCGYAECDILEDYILPNKPEHPEDVLLNGLAEGNSTARAIMLYNGWPFCDIDTETRFDAYLDGE